MLTTRCSACGTRFRLTLAQLDARGGRVRCGTCRTVFDARESLQLEDAEQRPAPPAAAPRSAPPGEAHADSISDPLAVALTGASADTPAGEGTTGSPTQAGTGPDPADAATAPPDEADCDRSVETAGQAGAPETVAVPAATTDMPGTVPPHAEAEAGTETAPEPPPVSDDAFVSRGESAISPEPPGGAEDAARAAPSSPADAGAPTPSSPRGSAGAPVGAATAANTRPAARSLRSELDRPFDFGPPPRRRSRTLLWGLGCLLLLAVLAGQAVYFWRGTIALLVPETKPHLAFACARLGCELPLPRRAELMSIESSDLQGHPNNPSVMVLAATLRNRAPFAQAFPALELTLTDDREQSLARRVLQPADYLGVEAAAPEGFPGNSERPVRVFMEASSLRATGYRLYLFYP